MTSGVDYLKFIKMLRVSREEDFDQTQTTRDNFNVFTGLRRCPSVADLFDLNQVERMRLETEAGIQLDNESID